MQGKVQLEWGNLQSYSRILMIIKTIHSNALTLNIHNLGKKYKLKVMSWKESCASFYSSMFINIVRIVHTTKVHLTVNMRNTLKIKRVKTYQET